MDNQAKKNKHPETVSPWTGMVVGQQESFARSIFFWPTALPTAQHSAVDRIIKILDSKEDIRKKICCGSILDDIK